MKVIQRRILVPLLVVCMIVVLMPLNVNAAAFSDSSSIRHSKAVQALTEAGVINGYPDGTFRPARTLTRAEACAILTRMDNGMPFGTAPYRDVAYNHWAGGYINYCTDKGYVNGYGDGKFGPEDTLTGAAWSKMVLGVVGYDAEQTGMVGTNWTAAVADIAETEDLYNDIDKFNPDRAVSRDNACQIAYNGLYEPETPPVLPPDDQTDLLYALSYSFTNTWSSFNYQRGYRIPLERYQAIIGNNERAKVLYEQMGDWGGSCYGMVSSVGLFHKSGNDIDVSAFRSSASRPNDLEISDKNGSWNRSLLDFIELMHVSQFTPLIQDDYDNNKGMENLTDAVHLIQGGEPVIITIFGVDDKGRKGGHAVLGYAVEDGDEALDQMLIYDPNFPNTFRSIALFKTNAGDYYGWYYSMNDSYDWGSDYPNGWISYMPYRDYYKVWADRAQLTASSMALITTNGDVTVSRPDGQPVVELLDGDVVTHNDNVVPFVIIGMTSDGTSVAGDMTAAWIPAGNYTVERAASDNRGDSLNVSITHVDQSVNITTDADRMTLAVDDTTKTRTASLDSAETGSSYRITIGSSLKDEDEPAVIALEGTVADSGMKLGQDSGSLISDGVNPTDIYIGYDGGVG